MTQKQRNYKQALIKSIHSSVLYKNIYANDRDLYESMLESRYGVKSSKDMGIDDLIKLDSFMNQRGGMKMQPSRTMATKNQISFILTLWGANSRNKDLFSLLKQVKKVIKRDISSLEDLTKKEAGAVIGSIKNIKPVKNANNSDYKPNKKDK